MAVPRATRPHPTSRPKQCLHCEVATPHVPGRRTFGINGDLLVQWWSCTRCDEGETI